MATRGQEGMGVEDRMEAGRLNPANDRVKVVSEGSNRLMKMVSLILLTPQYAVLILLMRYVRTRPGPLFFTSTTVLLAEVTKTLMCLGIILVQQGGPRAWAQHMYEFFISRPRDFMKVCLPSLLFVLQNNLIFVAISNLDAATFQVTYQLKILTTAIFSVVMLGKRLSVTQWISLLMLFAGVSIIQVTSALTQSRTPKSVMHPDALKSTLSASASASAALVATLAPTDAAKLHTAAAAAQKVAAATGGAVEQSYLTGLVAVLVCCCLSGFANVFFELLLKGGKQSVWLRNVQLGLSGAILGGITCLAHDGQELYTQGFFYGYDSLVWAVILLQSVGGLLVAAVIKYADNILKGFSAAGSILLSCVASVYIFDFEVDWVFIIGTALVLLSVYLYNLYPAVQPDKDTREMVILPTDSSNGKTPSSSSSSPSSSLER